MGWLESLDVEMERQTGVWEADREYAEVVGRRRMVGPTHLAGNSSNVSRVACR